MTITRRESVAAMAAFAAAAAEPIFDAHVHIWTSDVKRYPLAPGWYPSDFGSIPSITAEELMAHSKPQGVTVINLVQMTWYGLDHSYILDIIKKYPGQFVGTGIVPAFSDATLPSPDKAMIELAKGGILAFRLLGRRNVPGAGAQWMEHPGYEKMFRAAAAHNLALSFLMGPDDIPEVDRMCAKHPDAPVIIDHDCRIGAGGRIEPAHVDALCAMAKHRKVMVKVGAFYAFGSKKAPYTDLLPMIKRIVSAFGPDRCMWESDSPFQIQKPHTYAASVALIRDHADFLSASDKRKILFETANRFFIRR